MEITLDPATVPGSLESGSGGSGASGDTGAKLAGNRGTNNSVQVLYRVPDHGHEREAPVTTTVIDNSLNAADRCDRCGAQAYVRVTLSSGGELLFCNHHSKQHGDKLRQVALDIHDESEKLS